MPVSRRRRLLILGGGLAASTLLVPLSDAQPRPRRIAVLQPSGGRMNRDQVGGETFMAAMKELGYVEGRHYLYDFREWQSPAEIESLVRDLVRALVKFEIDPAIVAYLNSSQKKAQNIAALLLNDVYALMGAHLQQDALATGVRKLVQANVKRGKLKRAFEEEFSARIEQAFLEVTEAHVLRVLESERPAFERSIRRLPKNVREWLSATEPLPATAANFEENGTGFPQAAAES